MREYAEDQGPRLIAVKGKREPMRYVSTKTFAVSVSRRQAAGAAGLIVLWQALPLLVDVLGRALGLR